MEQAAVMVEATVVETAVVETAVVAVHLRDPYIPRTAKHFFLFLILERSVFLLLD